MPNDRFLRQVGSISSSLKCLEQIRAVFKLMGSILPHRCSHSALLFVHFGNEKNDKLGFLDELLAEVHFATAQNGIFAHP